MVACGLDKYEVAELTKKNQQSFDEFKNSLIKSQESNNHKILLNN
jgi:uncharacterized membrane-anchored protein